MYNLFWVWVWVWVWVWGLTFGGELSNIKWGVDLFVLVIGGEVKWGRCNGMWEG
ncbi:MAG: hypothetical protein HFI00_11350 [Lachnospiraceae bacterium]|nr:hypothetical protein [Lachnospiraceae bacterium]